MELELVLLNFGQVIEEFAKSLSKLEGVEKQHQPEVVPSGQAGLLGQMASGEQAEQKEQTVPVDEMLPSDDLRLYPQLHDYGYFLIHAP